MSTFMVEMTESARIISQATPSSLVILDEIGRGTSTKDGLALAEAIALHFRDMRGGGPRTLFATHFFELTKLAADPRITNLHVEVQEWGDQLHFLHRIAEGPADRSYGIQVARLAGMPKSIIANAQAILAEGDSEKREPSAIPPPRHAGPGGEQGAVPHRQNAQPGDGPKRSASLQGPGHAPTYAPAPLPVQAIPLFEPEPEMAANDARHGTAEALRQELDAIDIDNLTPMQALRLIAEWKNMI
jgi:DNA mismatch repair ATPase MutS